MGVYTRVPGDWRMKKKDPGPALAGSESGVSQPHRGQQSKVFPTERVTVRPPGHLLLSRVLEDGDCWLLVALPGCRTLKPQSMMGPEQVLQVSTAPGIIRTTPHQQSAGWVLSFCVRFW